MQCHSWILLLFLFLEIVEDHTYQTVDDDHGNAAKMPNYSEPCDSKVTAGVYSLYSAPDIPDAQYSVIQEPLNEYDLEHGYHIIGTAGNYTVINDKQSKPTEASVDNYATATSVSKVKRITCEIIIQLPLWQTFDITSQ